jgi:tetratricopeptide (TPR) repeat protein
MRQSHGRKQLVAGLVVALLAGLAYAGCLGHGFLIGDDEYNFVHNPHWRGFTPTNLRWMWTSAHNGHFHPLTWTTFALDHELEGGVDTRWLHATGLAWHALGSVLVFLLIRRLIELGVPHAAGGAPDLAAAAGALLFAVHPQRVESVAWLTERRDALSVAWLLLCVLAWLRRRTGGGPGWTVVALACYAASLLSKAWGITLPVVLLVLDRWPLRRDVALARLVREKAPFIALAAAGAALAVWAQRSIEAMSSWADHGLLQRTAQAAYGLCFYLVKTLVPLRLSHLYLLERELDPFAPLHQGALLVAVALSVLLWRMRRHAPAALAAWSAYVLLALPVLGFAQSGWQKVADRYAYLAVVPLAALLAGALVPAFARARAVTTLAALSALATLATLTWRQVAVFRDSESLWGRAVALDAGNYVALHNLSLALHQAGRFDEALAHESRAVQLHPEPMRELVLDHQGQLYQKRGGPGDLERAREAWRAALALRPRRLTAQRLVWSWRDAGEPARAEVLLEELIARDPDRVWAYEELGLLYLAQDRDAEALVQFQAGLRRRPGWAQGHFAAGSVLLAAGDPARAEPELRAAARLAPSADHSTQLASCLVELGRRDEARAELLHALELDPDHAFARTLLLRMEWE